MLSTSLSKGNHHLRQTLVDRGLTMLEKKISQSSISTSWDIMNIELFALDVLECISLLFHHLISWAREVKTMYTFMRFLPKPSTYKMLIADVNPEQSYIASIDENLSNWEDSLSVVFPSQVTGVDTRFSRPTPETYRFLFAPTNYMSPMARKHNIHPSINLDVKRKKLSISILPHLAKSSKFSHYAPLHLSLVSRCKTS